VISLTEIGMLVMKKRIFFVNKSSVYLHSPHGEGCVSGSPSFERTEIVFLKVFWGNRKIEKSTDREKDEQTDGPRGV
jgi:hypothetical protein